MAKELPKDSTKFRLNMADYVDPIVFAEDPVVKLTHFQDGLVTLYGPPKLGKSTLASCIPGAYFCDVEDGLGYLDVRAQRVSTWLSFLAFVEDQRAHPAQCKRVGMYVIDSIDVLVSRCMDFLCKKWNVEEPRDVAWGGTYVEAAKLIDLWILRLLETGPGVLLISHERQRKYRFRDMDMTRCSMDLSDTSYSVISNRNHIMLHMRNLHSTEKKPGDTSATRCLSTQGNELEDAGDRTKKLPSLIKFNTEADAVAQILACFEEGYTKIQNKPIKVKKVLKRSINRPITKPALKKGILRKGGTRA